MELDMRLAHPATFLVSGPTGSGKTVFTRELVRRRHELFSKPIHRVIWCHGVWQKMYCELEKEGVEMRAGVVTPDELNPEENTLVVFDDLMNSNSDAISEFFIRGSHHYSASVIYLCQNMFHQGKGHRGNSLNSHYIVAFKNVRSRQQFGHLAREIMGRDSKDMIESFEIATKEPYQYLFIDLRPETPDALRLRGRILDETNDVYVPRNCDISELLVKRA